MRPEEAALAGLHADALALLMRVQLQAGQAKQETLAQRHQQALSLSLDMRHAQSAIWGNSTAAQQRLEQTMLQKVNTQRVCMHTLLPFVAWCSHSGIDVNCQPMFTMLHLLLA